MVEPPAPGVTRFDIVVDRSPEGPALEFMPQDRYERRDSVPLNAHGRGPFCRFRVPGAPGSEGVYIITVDREVVYVGECLSFSRRFGLGGYGSIQPRNCYRGGQSTNCKINGRVLAAVTHDRDVAVWFAESPARKAQEAALIAKYRPPWNGR